MKTNENHSNQTTSRSAAQPEQKSRTGVAQNRAFNDNKTKNNPINGTTAQLESFSKEVTVKEKILSSDFGDWGKVRDKLEGASKGGDAGKIGGNVTKSLGELGIQAGTAMSAHQIPNRIGGTGGASDNVKPWNETFENGTWLTDVEQEFDTALAKAEVDEKVSYNVTTDDMSGAEAQGIIDKSTVESEKGKGKEHHKSRIQQIPKAVTATVGGKSHTKTLGKTTACYDGLIKE